MSKESKPIHYEPHPVSAKRKAELIAKGVRIIDAAFDPDPKPAKADKPVQVTKQGKEPTKQPAKADKPADDVGKPADGEKKPEGEATKE